MFPAEKTDSVIAFYNFGSVGQNEIDNNVSTYKYENQLILKLHMFPTAG